MPDFAYIALNDTGRRSTGVVSAGTRAAAIDQVMSQGMHPIDVTEQAPVGTRASAASRGGGRVTQSQVEAFTRELSHLLEAGVSLSRSLQLLSREASSPAAQRQWSSIRDEVVEGASLADAMAKFPASFPPVHVAMVRAGEAGGFLELVLAQIASFRARERDLRGKLTAALVYPAVLTLLMVIVVIVLMTFFIPRFQTLFDEFGGSLPILTKIIVAASHIVRTYGLAVAGVLIVAAVLARRMLMTDAGRRMGERWLLASPMLGKVLARFALVRFCRMLGTLVGAGVPLIASLRVAREAIGNQTLSDAVDGAVEGVQRGESLARSLADCPRLFPATVIEMVAVAEQTGRLDTELNRLAVAYEEDLDRSLRLLVATVEPALLIVMAAVIGTIVVGMLLPIFTLSSLVQ
ncbi:MAG: hypothetical protein GC159_02150 [Phycisphaera sp.]|nr:hypothetical protein [Phycisphaera sp.]